MLTQVYNFTSVDTYMEEGKPNLAIFPLAKANSPIVFLHAILHHSPANNVCTGRQATVVGHLLCTGDSISFKCFPGTPIFPFCNTIPSFWKHHVGDEVRCYTIWFASIGELVWMDCHKESRFVTEIWIGHLFTVLIPLVWYLNSTQICIYRREISWSSSPNGEENNKRW